MVEQISNYITIVSKALTPNNTIVPSGYNTGPLTATTLSDYVKIEGLEELVVNLTIQAVSGTSPTLTVQLLILDPFEASNGISTGNTNPPVLSLTLNATALSAVGAIRLVINRSGATVWVNNTATNLGNIGLPTMWQLNFVIGGTSPSFSIIGTYEARR